MSGALSDVFCFLLVTNGGMRFAFPPYSLRIVYAIPMHNEFDQIQSDIAHSIAKSCGLQPDLARFAANIAIIRIKAVMGGCTVYVPSNTINYRNALIKQQFNGKNHQKLAKTHQMSVRNIYRIVSVLNKVKIEVKQKESG